MCGFLGEYKRRGQLLSKQDFMRLLALSKHRGPDSTKISQGEFYQLGFNRLALLDLTPAGEQPKASPSGRYHMVFNGEVYNFKLLVEKHQLTNLRSSSDTEVILQLLDILPIEQVFRELNGMFAIAVVDRQTQELHLTRDFAGIKPLFFGEGKEGIVFASQFDQVFKHPWFQKQLSLRPEIMKEYFAFGYMQAPNTVFKHIYQVLPGEYIHVKEKDTIKKIITEFPQKINPQKIEISGLQQSLEKAVELQLQSDRPLASFLSGGIDSPLITAYAKKNKKQIQAFTLEVKDKTYNEAKYAKKYAKVLKVAHELVKVEKKELLEIVDEHFQAFSDPFGDYSSIPTYLVTQKAQEHHTAMLSGDGGDELFYGYPRMYDFLNKRHWFKIPKSLRKQFIRVTNKLGLTNTYAPFFESLEQFWLSKHAKLPDEILLNTFGKIKFSKEMNDLYKLNQFKSKKDLQHFLKWNEFYAHMQRVLIKVDRTSMKNSLEVRVPFLDKNVIADSWNYLVDLKELQNLKKPLKNLLEQELPPELLMKKKKGFSVPLEEWLKNELKIDLEKTVLERDLFGKKLFNQTILQEYVQCFLRGQHNNAWGVWHIYAWQKWAINQELMANE